MKRMIIGIAVAIACVALFAPRAAFCAAPEIINYQGMLTDKDGKPLNGTYDLTFSLWNAASGGIMGWEEAHTGVVVTEGFFNVLLGSVNANSLQNIIIAAQLLASDLYLEIKVGSETLSPRTKMGSVGYALYAQAAALSAGTLAMPAPAYDSGWTNINADQAITFTHNLGGNADNYVVDLWMKKGANPAQQAVYYIIGGNIYGASWRGLSATAIVVYRGLNDNLLDKVRVRIWKY